MDEYKQLKAQSKPKPLPYHKKWITTPTPEPKANDKLQEVSLLI